VIYPSDVTGSRRGEQLQAISNTWGNELKDISKKNVDVKTMLVVTKEEKEHYKTNMPAILEFFENVLVIPPALVKKLQGGIWLGKVDMGPLFVHMSWILEQILAQEGGHDWVFLASDQTYVFPHNLYCFLSQLDPSAPLHTGEMLKADYRAEGTDFVSVAAGWAFSMAFLKLFTSNETSCKAGSEWEEINWAVAFGRCIAEADALKDSFHDERLQLGVLQEAHRFNAFGPSTLVKGKTHSWFQQYHKKYYGVLPPVGLDCCAADTITFHYVNNEDMENIFATSHGGAGTAGKDVFAAGSLEAALLTEKILPMQVQEHGICSNTVTSPKHA
jgi:hypothetical protein